MMTITYPVKTGLYFNITNRCPCACTFCLRQNGEGVYGSDPLWLDHEPTLSEILADLDRRDLNNYTEAVFCGYGEPTERLDVLLAVASHLKERRPTLPIRINTNGLADLISGERTAPKLEGLIDTVSISLNSPDKEEYTRLVRPKFGDIAYDAMLAFAKDCVSFVPHVVLTVVDKVTTPEEQARCRALAEEVGATLRVRPFES